MGAVRSLPHQGPSLTGALGETRVDRVANQIGQLRPRRREVPVGGVALRLEVFGEPAEDSRPRRFVTARLGADLDAKPAAARGKAAGPSERDEQKDLVAAEPVAAP